MKFLKPALVSLLIVVTILFVSQSQKQSLVWKDTITLWTNALQNCPPNYLYYSSRGDAYARLNEFDKAINDFDSAYTYNSVDYNLYNSRGRAYYFTGQYDKAIDDLNKAIILKNDYFDAYLTRAGCYFQQKNYSKAIEDYNVILNLNPKHSGTFCNRAISYFYMGKYQLALADAFKAKEFGYNVPPGLFADIEKGIKGLQKSL